MSMASSQLFKDPEVEPILVCSKYFKRQSETSHFFVAGCRMGWLNQKDVLADYNTNEHNVKLHPQFGDAEIENCWKKRCKDNPALFNADKYRLHGLTINYPSNSEENNLVTFHIGRTSYRDFIGTNCSSATNFLKSEGVKLHGNSQAFLSDALGVGSVVKTCDGFIVFLRRSLLCGEAQGLLDRPGGHPEPPIGSAVTNSDVVTEIFDSVLREISDETNIPLSQLNRDGLLLMGVVRNVSSGGRPNAEFCCECGLTGEQVRRLYSDGGHSEAYESTELTLMTEAEVLRLGRCGEPVGVWAGLSPSTKGSLILYAAGRWSETSSADQMD